MASGKLRREIGKKRPFGTLEEEAMLNLFRTHVSRVTDPVGRWLVARGVTPDAVTVAGTVGTAAAAVTLIPMGRLFRKYGLTSSQYNVLRVLRGEGKPLPILEVAGRAVTVVPGITGLVDRLEQAGWVRRERCPDDRRVIFVAITEAAAELLARLDGPVRELQKGLFSRMAKAELEALIRLLEKAREHTPVEH